MNQIIHGDAKEILFSLPKESVNLIITSPPYYNFRTYSHWNSPQEYLDDMKKIMLGCCSVLVDGGIICWNIMGFGEWDWASHSSVLLHDSGFKFRESIIWKKPLGSAGPRVKHILNHGYYYPLAIHEQIFIYYKGNKPNMNVMDLNQRKIMMLKYQSNIWEVTPVNKITGKIDEFTGKLENIARHEAPFPKNLVRPLIWAYSKKNDIVCDPFAGTGTVCRVAYDEGRQYLGIEIDGNNCKLIEKNMAQKTLFESDENKQ